MSFASMPLYTGDYLRDTRHLTPQKHGIYLLSIMYCWDSKCPMPLDEQESAGICNCRSADEIESLRYILERFFIRMDDGWYNKRVAEEVAKWEQISSARSFGGLKSAQKRRDKARAGARSKADELKLNSSSTQVELKSVSPSPSPSPSLYLKPKSKTIRTSFDVLAYLAPHGISDQVIKDFQTLRKTKRLPITETAMKGIEREAKKAGISLSDAIRLCCERGWGGFKSEWVKEIKKGNYLEQQRDHWNQLTGKTKSQDEGSIDSTAIRVDR